MSGQETVIQSLVDGGKASAGPPLGPALGPTGVNVYQIIQAINEKTKDYAGLKVPVTITINTDDKSFSIEIGTPPTSALLMKELGIEKGSGTTGTEVIGNLNLSQIIQVAKIKQDKLLANSLKAAAKEVLGTSITLGVNVEDKHPKEIQKEIDEGVHDSLFTD
ncbi:MAG: 50S ribosomal protein L11 [Candidatus Lokiarchaeota archaeon]|nr:50S ribosomal protein L11 [Candidatus Lokiarchaeota archaeon]